MRWIVRPSDERVAQSLSKQTGLHAIAARVLAGRGIASPEAAERFLSARLSDLPDPFLMKAMAVAVERVERALRAGERITVYGDYDVDGVTSTTLLVSFLREVGADVAFYLPHRLAEGYGLNPAAIDRIVDEGARLVVTVDCGVTAVDEIDRAASLGVDVVVIDHHKAPEELPRAVAMLNPHQPGCDFPSKELSAVGVTFLFLMAMRKRLRESGFFEHRPEPNLRSFLDLVALGTVADVVPLVGANRILVAHGLTVLERGGRLGIRALKRVAEVGEGPITAGQVGFRLAPRINAVGRLDDAAVAVELLLTTDAIRAEELAESLNRANAERQSLERRIVQEAMAQASARLSGPSPDLVRGLVLSSDGWHPGVVGIVASRIAERFHRPAIVIGLSGDSGKGSCRGVERFNMYGALDRCRADQVRFGGHHHAAGVTVARERLESFTRAFEAEAQRQLRVEDLEPVVKVDAEVHVGDAGLSLAESLQKLAPFGAGNPEPVLSVEVSGIEARVLPAKDGGIDHLKFPLGGADAIAFGMSDKRGLLRGRAQVAFQLQVETWQGRVKASAKVKSIGSKDGRG